jgi:hypothetical protein
MSYYNFYGRAGNLWLNENRLNGLYNEYAQLNDVAVRNNNIYVNNVIDTNRKCCNTYSTPYIPSIYSAPYYASPLYASPYYGGYYGIYGRPFL